MPYRRTDNVVRKLAARQDAIMAAARDAAAEGGMAAVQMASIAERAGVAAGTIYRYFPSKTELVAALVAAVAEQESVALERAARAAPGPLSALAAAITTFAVRALAVAAARFRADRRAGRARGRRRPRVLSANARGRIRDAHPQGASPADISPIRMHRSPRPRSSAP